MYDLILWKNRRTEKANTYAVTQNPDKTITLTPVPGGIIEPGTGFNQQNMNHMDNGINEAMIIANMAIVQLLQHQRELENTYFEVGSVEVKSKETYPFNTEKVTVTRAAYSSIKRQKNYIMMN